MYVVKRHLITFLVVLLLLPAVPRTYTHITRTHLHTQLFQVWTPGDLFRSYFNLTYRLGARVHSDSWGSELTAYDGMSASLDRFTFTYQDFVSVFAAGGYRWRYMDGYGCGQRWGS